MHLLLPILLLLLSPDRLRAQPACGQARAGVIACMAGKLCRCQHEQGGSMTGLPPGWRWDCGALRPVCGATEAPAALPGGTPGGLEALPPLLLRPRMSPPPHLAPPDPLPPVEREGRPQPWR